MRKFKFQLKFKPLTSKCITLHTVFKQNQLNSTGNLKQMRRRLEKPVTKFCDPNELLGVCMPPSGQKAASLYVQVERRAKGYFL